MAAYPSYPQLLGSRIVPVDRMVTERASNGSLRARMLASGVVREFEVEHVLTDAERATLDTFYSTNRGLDIDFTSAIDNAAYTAQMLGPPEHTPLGAGYFRTRVRLAEV